ncbi:MAG: hypothetical protein EOP62_08265 [Sphingomonadales bacterium]|nr:MAG: hypothetical protein EOP62_08265 [Sphingomonadales bacterium]
MDDPILFNTDNRLLQSATGDFGMYGGQSDARFSVHEVRSEPATSIVANADADVADDLQTLDPPTPIASQIEAGGTAVTQAESGAGALTPQAFLIAPATTEFAPLQQVMLSDPVAPIQSDWSPGASGAGSFTPTIQAPEQAIASAAPIEALSDGPLMGPATAMLDDLADGPTLGPVVGSVTTLVGDVLTPVTGLVGDTLEGLAGSDPLGGIETLVNLVSISDTFDLTPVVAPLLETVSDTGQGLVDLLVGEGSLTDALLGDLHDGGLFGGHITPDHPLGL